MLQKKVIRLRDLVILNKGFRSYIHQKEFVVAKNKFLNFSNETLNLKWIVVKRHMKNYNIKNLRRIP